MLVGRADEVVYRYLTATRDMSREGKGAVIGYATIVGFPYGRVAHSNYKQFRETSTLTRQWILEHIQFGDMLLQDLRFMTDAKVMPRVDLAALKETLQRYHVSTAWIERKMNRGQPPVQVVQQQQQPMAPYMPAWQQQRQPMAPSMPGWQQQQQPQIGIPIYGQPPVGMGMPYNTPMFAPAAQPAQPWQGYPPPPAAYAPYARPPMQ